MTGDDADLQEEAQAQAVLEDLARLRGRTCAACTAVLCGHDASMSLVMGFKNVARCAACLAAALGWGREEMRDHLLAYITRRRCHNAGWIWANLEEGFAAGALPGCLWPAGAGPAPAATSAPMPPAAAEPPFDVAWDAGDAGCGDLVMELRRWLQPLRPGQVLKLAAKDPGAPEDLPAWCRLTGHALVASNPPFYWIRRKEG